MYKNQRILALIPAREGSKGLPGKNIKNLAGHPLLAWPVMAAKASKYIDRVVVSTDSIEYASIASEYGADVPVLRPSQFASDESPSSEAIIHMIDTLSDQGDEYDYFVLLEPTSPLTEGVDIDKALELLIDNCHDADSLVSVSELISNHPVFAVNKHANNKISPYTGVDFSCLPRRQNINPVYALDGSFYISKVVRYKKIMSFTHDRTLSFVMPHYKSLEVDSLVDFICIEAIMHHLDKVGDLT